MRILAKREANEQRRKRFLNARKRLIGLDVEGLNQQLAERDLNNEKMKETNRLEGLLYIIANFV